eukprot:351226-Chlamydomonas_euryale.AAC.6
MDGRDGSMLRQRRMRKRAAEVEGPAHSWRSMRHAAAVMQARMHGRPRRADAPAAPHAARSSGADATGSISSVAPRRAATACTTASITSTVGCAALVTAQFRSPCAARTMPARAESTPPGRACSKFRNAPARTPPGALRGARERRTSCMEQAPLGSGLGFFAVCSTSCMEHKPPGSGFRVEEALHKMIWVEALHKTLHKLHGACSALMCANVLFMPACMEHGRVPCHHYCNALSGWEPCSEPEEKHAVGRHRGTNRGWPPPLLDLPISRSSRRRPTGAFPAVRERPPARCCCSRRRRRLGWRLIPRADPERARCLARCLALGCTVALFSTAAAAVAAPTSMGGQGKRRALARKVEGAYGTRDRFQSGKVAARPILHASHRRTERPARSRREAGGA